MKITKHIYPWEYNLVDDFLRPDELEQITNRVAEIIDKNDLKNTLITDKFHESGKRFEAQHTNLWPSFMKDRYEEMLDLVGYQRPNQETEFTCHLSIMGNKMSYPTHEDMPAKLTSTVLYLGDIGNGTLLYGERDGPVLAEAEWKHNRAMYFQRSENTWHAYHNIRNEMRVTMIMNTRIPQ